jgi:hypothetical protein
LEIKWRAHPDVPLDRRDDRLGPFQSLGLPTGMWPRTAGDVRIGRQS